MLRRGGLLFALALIAAGCSIDRVEWETTGHPVEEVRQNLEEEHGVANPAVECIQREVQGAVWECRAQTAEGEFECEVKTHPHEEVVRDIVCEPTEEEEPAGEEEAPAETTEEAAEG